MPQHNKSHIREQAKTKSFLLKIRNKTRVSISTTLIQLALEVLATVIRQEKKRKCIQIGKEEVKLSSFADDMMLYIENYEDSDKMLVDLINKFFTVVGYKINIHNWYFFTLMKNYQKEKLREQLHLLLQKIIRYLGINKTKEV